MIDTSAFTLNFDDEGDVVAPIVDVDRAELLRQAVAWQQAGCSVIPIKMDGSKAPFALWKKYQSERASVAEIASWFNVASGQYDGFGIVTGEVSGHLEMLELEGLAISDGILPEFTAALMANGVEEAWTDLCNGYVEASGGEGVHFFFRTEGPAKKNTKLARRPAPEFAPIIHPETGRQITRIKTLLETRGEGGQVVAAPSAGRTRAKGGAWTVLVGDPSTIPTISVEDRDVIYAIATRFDAMPEKTGSGHVDRSPDDKGYTDGLRPGDDFMEKVDWDDERLLGGAGWKKAKRMEGGGWGWKRPGKDTPGISATTGMAGRGAEDRLYVFSSSTEFPTEEPLSKFYVYATLHHDGDMREAARALGRDGFGEPATVAISEAGQFDDLIGHLTVAAGAAIGEAVSRAIDTLVSEAPATSTIPPDTVPDDFGDPVPEQGPSAPRVVTADTQDAHALMVIAAHGASIRYCPEMKKWLRWQNHLWKPQADDGGIVYEHAKEVARSLPEGSKEEVRYKRACLTANGLSAALRIAQTDRAVRVSVDELDAHPWEINTPEGIIDLRTGALHPPRPSHLHTKSTLVAPDFDADRSAWLAFLATTFGGDHEVIEWVQRLFGYACVGEVREHVFPVLYGQGANGKSVLLETISGLLGDYAITLPPKFLTQNGQGVTDAAGLIGVRLAVASETNEGESFDEALVKRLTGGDTVRARFMRQDWFQFTPSHTLMLATNHRLEVPSGGGRSFWRRVREVPFNHIVPDEQQDAELSQKLIAEHGPAIMAWLAEGAAKYARDGLSDPASVRAATAAYAESADQIGQYLDERCAVYAGAREKVADVYRDYTLWCADQGLKSGEVKGRKVFIEALKRHGGESRKGTHGYFFVYGIRLLTDEEIGVEKVHHPVSESGDFLGTGG